MSGPWSVGGTSALRRHAPAAAAAMAGLVSSWPEELSAVRLSMIRTVTAEAVGLPPLRAAPTGPRRLGDVPEAAVMAFAEQFAADVTLIDDNLRAAWHRALGPHALTAARAVYVADQVPRVRSALGALFGPDEWYAEPLVRTTWTEAAVQEFLREVVLLDRVDPVTTELVRLRGARLHECRAGQTRRSLAAIAHGADAAMFAAVDHHRSSDLPPATRAALGLVDAMTWTPADLRRRDVDAVREHLTPAQAVEVVLDVARDAVEKIDVALGPDLPAESVELFDVEPDGTVVYP